LLGRASSVELDIMRGTDDELWCDFKIQGSLRGETESIEVRDFLTFLAQLVGDFTRPRPDGEGGGV
jgi:hypothetical protein